MKKLSKILAFLLIFATCMGLFGAAAFADGNNGVEIKVKASRREYKANEDVKATMTITNKTGGELKNITVESQLPDGYAAADGVTTASVAAVANGESAEVVMTYTPTEKGSFFTSLSFYLILAGVALVAVVVVIVMVAKKKKKAKKSENTGAETLLSLLLCAGILLAALSGPVMALAQADVQKETVDLNVTVDGNSVFFRYVVSYELPAAAPTPVSDQYTVTFESNGGSAVDPQTVTRNHFATVPGIPTRDDYIFIGWYADQDLTKEYDFATPVTGDITLYAKWSNIYLKVSQSEFYTGESGTVYFYAETTVDAEVISLKNAADGAEVLQLRDDGQYDQSGDDLPDDKIFSGKLDVTAQEEIQFDYFAALVTDDTVRSQTVSISFIQKLTEEELDDIEKVDARIQSELFDCGTYDQMTLEQRKTQAETTLKALIAEGLVVEDSLVYDKDACSYGFQYKSGVAGCVIFKVWPTGETMETEPAQSGSTSGAYASAGSSSASVLDLGEAIVLWSFDQAWDEATYRKPFYENLEKEWDAAGLETTVVWNTTVEDYKNLEGYEVIIFSGHGSYSKYTRWFKSTTCSSLLLHQKTSFSQNRDYSADLKKFRVGIASVQGGKMYAILPDFFSHYYDRGDLEGSFIFAENCEFRGKNNNVNAEMPNALREASAAAVVGFHNSVMATYSRNLAKAFVDGLMAGKNAGAAYDDAVARYGANDYYIGREEYGPTAYPLFAGDRTATLIKASLENGSFELGGGLKSWSQTGDVRSVAKLGDLVPQDKNKMAILTTGIGSAEEKYLGGTEGSVLSQVFTIPTDACVLFFTYDMVSEEPMEYVNSQYDDTFEVRLITDSATVILAKNTINTASWTKIDGINFQGGDSTTYHTQWQSVQVDISAYAGQSVKLMFVVYDKGDSLYDTAVLLDNVIVK